MKKFCENMEQSLHEAIQIETGNIPLTERKDMPAPTFYVEETGSRRIDEPEPARAKY